MFINQRNFSNVDQTAEMKTPFHEKIILLCTMLMSTLIFALLPFKLLEKTRQNSKWKNVVSLASCFSGGVFIGACILDLFPDVHEAMNRVLDEIEKVSGQKIDYPAAGFVICVGFFIVLIIEQIILSCKESWYSQPFETNMSGETTSLLHEQDLHRDHSHQDHQISNSGYGSTSGSASNGAISGLSSIEDENAGINLLDQTHNHDHMGDVFQHSTLR